MPGDAGPPSYPRTAHLPPVGVPVRDDLVLSDAEAARLLADEVIVEEKLDGANVAVWLDTVGVPQAATRGGPGALDRANQLGPLRGWIAAHGDELRSLLAPGDVLYGGWLWWRHAVAYDALPDWLVVRPAIALVRAGVLRGAWKFSPVCSARMGVSDGCHQADRVVGPGPRGA